MRRMKERKKDKARRKRGRKTANHTEESSSACILSMWSVVTPYRTLWRVHNGRMPDAK